MQPRRHSRPPPWERQHASPHHPIGRARRRWPRAHDGGAPVRERINCRYHRAFDGDAAETERRRGRIPRLGTLDRLRNNPARNGLIGLAVAGVAAPVAINTYQEALRGDPAHERIATTAQPGGATDDAVTEAWQAMEAERTPEVDAREASIQANMERYAEYGVTRQLAEDIYDAALQHDIDPDIAFGLVRAESSFRNSATSPVGAVGLTQLMPRTAAWMEPGVKPADLRNQQRNLYIGFKYLNYLMDKYNGNSDLALTAYNRGPGTVDRVLRQGGNPDNGYTAFVLGQEGHGHRLFTNR